MRKLKSIKKRFFVFHSLYEGKPEGMNDHFKKVEAQTYQNLRFLNMSRLMRIINYDPIKYLKTEEILHKENEDKFARRPSYMKKKRVSVDTIN